MLVLVMVFDHRHRTYLIQEKEKAETFTSDGLYLFSLTASSLNPCVLFITLIL